MSAETITGTMIDGAMDDENADWKSAKWKENSKRGAFNAPRLGTIYRVIEKRIYRKVIISPFDLGECRFYLRILLIFDHD